MKRCLVEILVCPECGGTLQVDPYRTEEVICNQEATQIRGRSWQGNHSESADRRFVEIMVGLLSCQGCLRAYPIIGGVPRMLPDDLKGVLELYHGTFFELHPEISERVFQKPNAESPDPFASCTQATYRSFSVQRVELSPPDLRFSNDWMTHFEKRVMPYEKEYFRGKRGLDAGCGFGRHIYCAHACGAEIVGLDLSEGVQRAFENNRACSRAHVVQGDIFRMPFRPSTFDFAFSFGVLHHLPNAQRGFECVARAVRPGGDLMIWVYGCEGMSWAYRVSHMRTLRRLVRRLPETLKLAICVIVAFFLECTLWLPSRALSRMSWGRKIAERLPAANNSRQPFRMKVTAVFDRLATPITHFHNRNELLGWFRSGGFSRYEVSSKDRRGWQASGTKAPAPPPAQSAAAHPSSSSSYHRGARMACGGNPLDAE